MNTGERNALIGCRTMAKRQLLQVIDRGRTHILGGIPSELLRNSLTNAYDEGLLVLVVP
jgi:hypothetical protein